MKRSTDRDLVTHVGSLARPKDLMEMLVARNEGKDYDSAALARRTREAVSEVVQKQIDCGSISSTTASLASPISRAIRASG